MRLIPIRWNHILSVWRIYLDAFPIAERRPFAINLRLARKGVIDLLTNDGGKPVCLVCAAAWDDLVLIDYLAVDANARGGGIGTQALRAALARYAGKRIFLEIEIPDPADGIGNDFVDIKARRKNFYLRNGFADTGVYVKLFGVPLELLSYEGRPVRFTEYHNLYTSVYGEWSAGHVVALDC